MTQGLSVLNHKNFSPFQYLIGNGCRDTFRQPARLKYAAFLIGYALPVLPDVLLSLGLSAAVIELRLLENHTAPRDTCKAGADNEPAPARPRRKE